MTEKELKETRVQLYKATPLKLDLVDQLISAIKNCFHGVETTSIKFDSSCIMLADKLQVRMIEIDPQEIGGVLIHWYPIKNLSLRNDPYCSAYILTEKEIRKLIKTLQNVSNYYIEHSKV